jgi:fructan beta-fructosidase
MAFSGSAVVDHRNTSGFGTAANPPMVAIFTGHRQAERRQTQDLAYSTDRGRTWTRYEGNPVLDIGASDFRDPNVFWYEPEEKWVMAVVLSPEQKVQFYESPNLKDWTLMSEFGPAGAPEGIWECPDLFELPIEGQPGETRWVLQVDINPGAVAGGSGGQYFIGEFDGTKFTRTEDTDRVNWVDYGPDFYAAIDWANIPEADGRTIWVGWMNNWTYAQDLPTYPWRSAQSIPRSLTLKDGPNGLRLAQQPVDELAQLRDIAYQMEDVPLEGTLDLGGQGLSGRALEIVATFEVGAAREVGLKVRTGDGEETVVGYDVAAEEVFVDRRASGDVGFHPRFAGRHAGAHAIDNGQITLRVFVDWSSVEVFADGGYTVLTERIFPSPESAGAALYASGGAARLVSLEAWNLKSIWRTAANNDR